MRKFNGHCPNCGFPGELKGVGVKNRDAIINKMVDLARFIVDTEESKVLYNQVFNDIKELGIGVVNERASKKRHR